MASASHMPMADQWPEEGSSWEFKQESRRQLLRKPFLLPTVWTPANTQSPVHLQQSFFRPMVSASCTSAAPPERTTICLLLLPGLTPVARPNGHLLMTYFCYRIIFQTKVKSWLPCKYKVNMHQNWCLIISLMRDLVQCFNQFKEKFRIPHWYGPTRNSEMNLPVNVKLICSQGTNQLHSTTNN